MAEMKIATIDDIKNRSIDKSIAVSVNNSYSIGDSGKRIKNIYVVSVDASSSVNAETINASSSVNAETVDASTVNAIDVSTVGISSGLNDLSISSGRSVIVNDVLSVDKSAITSSKPIRTTYLAVDNDIQVLGNIVTRNIDASVIISDRNIASTHGYLENKYLFINSSFDDWTSHPQDPSIDVSEYDFVCVDCDGLHDPSTLLIRGIADSHEYEGKRTVLSIHRFNGIDGLFMKPTDYSQSIQLSPNTEYTLTYIKDKNGYNKCIVDSRQLSGCSVISL